MQKYRWIRLVASIVTLAPSYHKLSLCTVEKDESRMFGYYVQEILKRMFQSTAVLFQTAAMSFSKTIYITFNLVIFKKKKLIRKFMLD